MTGVEAHKVQSVVTVAVHNARLQSATRRELAQVLGDTAQVLDKLSREIVRIEDLTARIGTCNQQACEEPAEYVVRFPGHDEPDGICAEHAEHARGVYAALAVGLHFTPIADWKPALGELPAGGLPT